MMKKSFSAALKRDLTRNKTLYPLAIPMIAFYVIFCYGPIYGQIIAFKDFSPALGILGSKWVGLKHFIAFFKIRTCWELIRNTLMINVYALVFTLPAPIIFALLLNEVQKNSYKRVIQTVSYLPHFISLVVVCGMILEFTRRDGVVNDVIAFFSVNRISFMSRPEWFRPIYTITDIWQGLGWGSIIYIAAISGIDPGLYEAAIMDGAGRFRKMWHITLPGIREIIVIVYILKIGQMMSVGFEKIILLYNGMTYETADVISSYIYRVGLMEMNFSYSSAVGLFNSVINFILLVTANRISRKLTEGGLW
jgi:putative aldouronate transport system permease protein